MTSIAHGFIAPRRDSAAATSVLIATILAAWFAIVLFAGRAAAFEAGASGPPLPLLAAIVVPPALFAIAYRTIPGVRAWTLAVDLRVITAVEAWRVIGGVFLFFHAYGALPGIFAYPAGIGDVAVGIAAVFVLRAMLRETPGWRRRVFWLNIAGLADFVGAIGTGVLTSNSALGLFYAGPQHLSMGSVPLVLIPAFAVPLWIIFHMISLLQLRQR